MFGFIDGMCEYLQVRAYTCAPRCAKRDYVSVFTESNIAQTTLKYTLTTEIFGIN
ncbi:hypothetical protein NIES4072_43440 [Nostoc commune NIES-4072]|uniref:Uncharacterized protein n=1 Tax=Nostoc commune NIES-4072 TaxID=2005467 RepID=A0A2R5FWQ1_NOSCO|nr:hypothetical protein NIES4070_47390 [Nostoc commune HK-02]GBG20663.1 hypothetical protein NIES4072_43440 [Nostoc commune NIES-4072]